jgi:hypothetical protein
LADSDSARAAARDLAAEGVDAFQAGSYEAASSKLERAFTILRVPTLGLWSARALAKTGKLVEASERYLLVTRLDAGGGDLALQNQAKVDAASEREALQPKIASLTIDAKGASAEATYALDGAPLSSALLGVKQPANPGRHTIEARDAGRVLKREITLTEGQRLPVLLELEQAVPAPPGESAPAAAATGAPPVPSPQTDNDASPGLPAGFWVGVGVTGAGLLTGGIAAALAAQKKSDLNCPNNVCAADQRDDVDAYHRLGTISTIGFVAAGVGAVTTGIFFFTRPKAAQQARVVTPYVGLGSAGVLGIF